MFLIAEGINTVYFRILAQYDYIGSDENDFKFKSDKQYWMTLGLLQVGFFIFLNIKYFLINIVILNSNEAIH